MPGCLLLGIRFFVAFWFLTVLRHGSGAVDQAVKPAVSPWSMSIDVVQFAAGFLLWIVVQPLVVFIGEIALSSLWRHKAIASELVLLFALTYVLVGMSGGEEFERNE